MRVKVMKAVTREVIIVVETRAEAEKLCIENNKWFVGHDGMDIGERWFYEPIPVYGPYLSNDQEE